MNSQLSKSEKKRRAKGIEQLVYELASLPDRVIGTLPCNQEIQEEIRSAKNLKGGAKKDSLNMPQNYSVISLLKSYMTFLPKKKVLF